MKKYITIAALLAAGTAVANAATISAEDLNKNLGYYLTDASYTSWELTFTIDGAVNTVYGVNKGPQDILSLGEGWVLKTQVGRYVGLSYNNGDPAWISDDHSTYSSTITYNSSTWLFDAEPTLDGENPGSANVNGATVKISCDEQFGVMVSSLLITKGDAIWVGYGDISAGYVMGSSIVDENSANVELDLANISFLDPIGASSATITLDGVSYNLAIPEPSAFGFLAGIGALALVASRRRRK